jgi:hypothetical protein
MAPAARPAPEVPAGETAPRPPRPTDALKPTTADRVAFFLFASFVALVTFLLGSDLVHWLLGLF